AVRVLVTSPPDRPRGCPTIQALAQCRSRAGPEQQAVVPALGLAPVAGWLPLAESCVLKVTSWMPEVQLCPRKVLALRTEVCRAQILARVLEPASVPVPRR